MSKIDCCCAYAGTTTFLPVFSDFYFLAVTDLIPYGDLYGFEVPADFYSPMFKLFLTSEIVPNWPFGETYILAILFEVASVLEKLCFLAVSFAILLDI